MLVDKHRLVEFCERWELKASGYDETILADSFDKFFTLFVIYNRLYVEVGNLLIVSCDAYIEKYLKRSKCSPPISDRIGAIKVVPFFLASFNLGEYLKVHCSEEVLYMANTIELGNFYFCYDYINDIPNFKKDRELTEKAKSYDASAILELIYVARCNMFHGSKEFDDIQFHLIKSMNRILEHVIGLIKNKLLKEST